MDIQTQVDEFKALSYNVQKEKIVDMLKQLQWMHKTFAMLYTTIPASSTVSEDILIQLYQAILEIAQEIRSGKKEKTQDKINKMAQIIIDINKQEKMEKEREWNPDDMLKKI